MRTSLVSMLTMLARPWPQLRNTLRHVLTLRFGARSTNGAGDTSPAGEDGLHGIVVVQPIVVGPALALRPRAHLEATGHFGQNPGMRPQVSTIAFIHIGGGAIALAQLAPTDGDVGTLVPAEAGAGHGHAEAVADADIEIGRCSADGPFELGVAPAGGYVIGAADEHGARIREADGADLFVREGGRIAAGPAVPPVPKVVAGGAEGDADAVAVAAGASRDGGGTSGGGVASGGGVGRPGGCGVGSWVGRGGCCRRDRDGSGVVMVLIGKDNPRFYESESDARVCVCCLHVEGW